MSIIHQPRGIEVQVARGTASSKQKGGASWITTDSSNPLNSARHFPTGARRSLSYEPQWEDATGICPVEELPTQFRLPPKGRRVHSVICGATSLDAPAHHHNSEEEEHDLEVPLQRRTEELLAMSPSEMPNVLIVDDNEDDRVLTERLLEVLGFVRPYVAADSGANAIKLLSDAMHEFHVAFLDVRMPLMDGLELLSWIRSRSKYDSMKVVMLTSSDDANDIARAQAAGADGYLLKQDSKEKCAAILSHLLPELVHTKLAFGRQ